MKTFHRSMAFLLIALLLSGMIFAFRAKATNPPAQNVVPAGNDNYVSAHQYISPTSDPYVFKVTTELSLSQKNTVTTDVVIHANLGHMYYEDGNNITPVIFPDGTSANKIYQLEKYAAQQLVELLCDPTVNSNWENTRIGLTVTAVNRATSYNDFRDVCDAEFLSDLVNTTQKTALLNALDAYNPSRYRTNTTVPGLGTSAVPYGRGGSNKYADAKGIQRAYQLLTDQPLYFQPTKATKDGNYTSAQETFISPAWTFIRSDGTTVAGDAATPMWFENPSVAGESDVKHQKFIIWLGAGLMGGNGDRSPWNNPKKNAASYEMKPSTDPIGTLDLTNNVADNPYSNIDVPYFMYSLGPTQWFHYYRGHKWTRYHTAAISTLLEQQSDNDKMRNFQMLALWPTAQTSGGAWPGYNYFRLDFLDSITKGTYLPMSSTRPYAMNYNQYFHSAGYAPNSPTIDPRTEYYDEFGGTNNWGSWGDLHIINSFSDLEATINSLVVGIVPKITIDSHFGLAEQFSFENIYGGIQVSDGTVVQNGKSVTWSLPDVISGTFTMIFYIRMDPDLVEDGLYYPPFDTSYIEYDRNPLSELGETGTASVHVILPFPTIYVSPNGDVQSPLPSPTDSAVIGPADSNASSSSTQEGLIPILGAPINSGVPYTPSVTPNSNHISSEKLEEEVDAVPVTSSPVLTVVVPLAIVALVGISIAYVVKKRHQKH